VIVSLDENSYSFLGVPLNSGWPRKYHAILLDQLAALGAKRVLFDILFTSPSSEEEDRMFAASIAKLPVVLGVDSKQSFEMGSIITRQEPPLPILKNAAQKVGLVGFKEDFGFVRTFYRHNNVRGLENLPNLSQAALDNYPHGLPGQYDHLNYYGPESTIPSIPVKDILSLVPGVDPLGDPPLELKKQAFDKLRSQIEGRTVFVGLKLFTELGAAQKDSYRTPFEKLGGTFGVEIHATATSNIAYGTWLKKLSPTSEGITLLFLSIFLSTLTFRLRPDAAGALVVISIAVWIVVSYLAFTYNLLLPGITLFAGTLPPVYLASTLYYYYTTRKSQLQTKKAFEFYLSPEMAEEVAKNPAAIALGGKGEYATAVFTDIAGFTTITETMSPEQVSEMLNAYFSEVMDVIFPLKGTLIKFIGDAVFALWGAPLKVPDHALKACQAALAIQEEVEKFNNSNRFPALRTRIGVHTGSMVVGNLGSHRRFDFTAIGDSVNLASRVEGVNKYFGTTILITDTVNRELKGQLPTLLLGSIAVAGKNESISLFNLTRTPFPETVVKKWEKVLRDFQFRRWDQALDGINSVISEAPALSTAAELYRELIEEYKVTPPPEEWNGTVSFSKK
jgi:adenylate cyclase